MSAALRQEQIRGKGKQPRPTKPYPSDDPHLYAVPGINAIAAKMDLLHSTSNSIR